MKKISIIIVAFVILLTGCNKNEVSSTDANLHNDATQEKEVLDNKLVVKDNTKKIDAIDISQVHTNAVISVEAEASFSTRCQTVEEIYDNSQYIVRGKVNKVYFTVVDGMPYTVLDFKISDSLKGNLEENTINTVLMYGGYMTVQQEVDNYGSAERFSSVKKKDWKKTFIEKKLTNSDYPKAGEEYVLSLMDSEIIEGTYVTVNEFETIFKKQKDSYVRTLPSEDYFSDSVDDSGGQLKDDKSFDYSWFSKKCQNSKRKNR